MIEFSLLADKCAAYTPNDSTALANKNEFPFWPIDYKDW